MSLDLSVSFGSPVFQGCLELGSEAAWCSLLLIWMAFLDGSLPNLSPGLHLPALAPISPASLCLSCRGSLGSLVASPGLAFLAGPGAVLSVALLEAGWWAGYSKIDSIFP